MAKKDKKKKKDTQGSGAADAVEAVRNAVERTFQATAEGASGTQDRTRRLVDEVGAAAVRIRDTIEDLRVLDEVKGLRAEIEALARRVASLERSGTPASPTPAAKPSTSRSTASKPRATRSTASKPRTTTRSTAAKSSGTRASKTTGTRSTAAKPRGTRSTAAKSTSTRSRTTPKRGSSSGGS